MIPDESAVGHIGFLSVATRGDGGPGEVVLAMGGGTEAYLAYSEVPLTRGTEVLVFNARGNRSVDVVQFDSEPEV
jgi:hypothetical protein